MDRFFRVYDGTRYLILFGGEKYDFIYSRIRFFIGVKVGTTYVISDDYTKIKIYSYDALPLEKAMTFHNFIINIKSVFNKDQNYYYYNILLEKCSY